MLIKKSKLWDCLGCHLLLPEPGGGLKWGTGGWEIVGYRTRTPGQVYSTKYNLLFKANSFRSPKLEGCAMRICQLLKFEQNRRTIASLIKIKNSCTSLVQGQIWSSFHPTAILVVISPKLHTKNRKKCSTSCPNTFWMESSRSITLYLLAFFFLS